MWKATNIGGNKLEILPSDPLYTAGVYYIGIFAYAPNMNLFTVKAELTAVSPVTVLHSEHTGNVGTWDYYQMPIEYPDHSRLEVTVDPGLGVLALFVSPRHYYPSEQEHVWSMVSATQGWLSAERAEHLGIYSAEQQEDMDPFGEKMKKKFVRCPNAQEFALLREQEQVRGNGETLLFCSDTDEWKYPSPVCFLAVKNLTDAPVQYTIRSREVLETTLLGPVAAEKYTLFNSLFENVEGGCVSQDERKRLGKLGKCEFTYGEVEFLHLMPVLELCQVQAGQVFWDLGCGAGKCLVTVSLVCPQLQVCKGVEFLDRLYTLCSETVGHANERGVGAPIQVYQGDMLQVDWSDADLLYMSSICFPQELMNGVFEKTKLLKKGTKIITLKNFPHNEDFEVRFNMRVKMTWGRTGVYILEKVR